MATQALASINPKWKQIRYVVVTVLSALILGATITVFISRLPVLGHYVPSHHIVTDYMVALFWGLGIAMLLMCFPVALAERRILIALWAARCGVTLFGMLFYENHYTIDSYGYYEASINPTHDFRPTGFGHGTDNAEALSWLMNHYLPVMDSYHALKVAYSFFGFLGCYFIYRGFTILLERDDSNLLFLIFLFPSMAFWSSTLGKDPLTLLGIALYVYGTIGLTKLGRFSYVIPMVFGVFLSSYFRSWNLIILLVPLGSIVVRGIKSLSVRVIFLSGVVGAMFFSLRMFAQQFGLESTRDIVAATQSVSHSWNYGGSAMNAPEFTSVWGMLKFAPFGMFTALFRPLPGEVMNPFGLLAGFENLFLLIFLFMSVNKIRQNSERLKNPQLRWAIVLILVWSFIYSFVSFQNMGAAIRFRLQILPVMLSVLYCFTTEQFGSEDVRDSRVN